MGGRFSNRNRSAGRAAVTVGSIVSSLLPDRPASDKGFSEAPRWPPDVFAVAAALVSRSGCYASARPESDAGDLPFGDVFTARIRRHGEQWRKAPGSSAVAKNLARLWGIVIAAWDEALADAQPYREDLPAWCVAALELLCLSDEASRGIGVSPPEPGAVFPWFYFHRNLGGVLRPDSESPIGRADLTATVCIEVPADRVCVQPKTRSPRVGCTMRSLSHNLALLPPTTEIRTRWLMVPKGEQPGTDALNLLIVPFPYCISGKAFSPTKKDKRGWGMFGVSPEWQPDTADEFYEFLLGLLEEARHEVGEVDGILLPELALDADFARQVAARLAGQPGLEFFICGVQTTAPAHRNQVAGYIYNHNRYVTHWLQSKHHRWKLDPAQVATYSLGDALAPGLSWWEDIEVGNRELHFYQVRPRASLAVLVCEDLARQDPVQSVIRSVGPSLVVALLMDGAQLKDRWPGRYATVLAEDPGSSVLTLTSLGMLQRGFDPRRRPSRSIGLWRDATGSSRELELLPGRHGLLLTLSPWDGEERTMDGRNTGQPVQFQLTGVQQVEHPAPPPWLSY